MNEYIGVKDGFEPSMQEVAEPATDEAMEYNSKEYNSMESPSSAGENVAPVAEEQEGAKSEETKEHNSECAEARRQGAENAKRDFDSVFCDNDSVCEDFDSTVEVNGNLHTDDTQNENQSKEKYKGMVIEQRMREDLAEIKAIDPNISGLSQLGDNFAMLIASGVPAAAAYHATRAMLEKEVFSPSMGGVSTRQRDSGDFFTREEVALMSCAQIKRHYKRVRKSMASWK